MKSETAPRLPVIKGAKPRILIVEARFYHRIADELLAGAKARLDEAGADYDVITVPGALEIPGVITMALRAAAELPRRPLYDGFVALGTVIRGETSHYDVVANQANRALTNLVTRHGIALGNGILTVENEAQAFERAKKAQLDKGGGAALACLVMIAISRDFGLMPAQGLS